MNRKYLFGVAGLALGVIISFYWTRSFNTTNAGTQNAAAPTAAMPSAGVGDQKAMMGDVAQTIEKAKSNPKDYDAQVAAARVFYQIQRFGEAVEYLEKAYAINPAEIAKQGALGFIGQYYFDQKKYEEAEKWLNKAVEADPNEPDAHIILAETFMQRQPPQPDKAIQALQRAIKVSPKNGHAYGHLVEAYALKKDAKAAEEALAKLKEAEPANNRIAALQTLVADVKAGKAITLPSE
ncbi:MAG: tetratricopeptide repeat protein [Acidobacteria bacterium]|nr:tetratricopeptide repeat protein [Acidobacteriota bacterium]